MSRAEFVRKTGISEYFIYRLFPVGGWLEAVELAGLTGDPHHKKPVSDHDLLAEFHRVVRSCGHIPTWPVFASQAKVSDSTIRRRFGGIQGTMEAYGRWLRDHEPDSPFIESLQVAPGREIWRAPETQDSVSPRTGRPTKTAAIEYGAPISFRGLRHAPVNEQGVVYLFGMIAYELGFLVEAIHTSYPDCEAKRCVVRNRERWQRVYIEFEYRSSNFRDHGHDPARCNLVVCWENDWADCPVEILELRRAIDELKT